MKELDNKNKGFTLIELLAVIIIISVIAVVAVPKILDVIENSKRQTSIESGQLYARAVNQNMTFSDLDSSKYKSFFKSGKSVYSVKELSSVTVKNKPKSGSVTINDKRVVGANLCINEYNIIYNNGKWSAEKSDKCSTTNTIDPSTLPKYEENEVVYFDPINYKLCDNETDTCYAWLVLHGNIEEGKYELVYKNASVYDYSKAIENNNGSYDGALVNYINTITETWSDKIPKPEAKYNINNIFDFTESKARIMNSAELSENDLATKLDICYNSSSTSCSTPVLVMGDSNYNILINKTLSNNNFPFSGASSSFSINPVINVDLTDVDNVKDYIGLDEYVCDEHIYDNGTISESEYNKICKNYIDPSIYSTSENSDGTINISGFKNSAPSSYKDNVWALPTKIGGKTVAGISTASFAQKSISSKLIISPTIKIIDNNSFVSNSILALALPDSVTSIGATSFAGNNISSLIIPGSIEKIEDYAFVSNNISSLVLNEGIKSIGNASFSTNSIKSLKLPDSLTSLDLSFGGNALEELDTGGGSINIEVGTFSSSQDSLKKLILGNDNSNVEQVMGQNAFQNFTVLTDVTINGNIKSISKNAFNGDSKLSTVTLSPKIETIDEYAFSRCTALKKLVLPDNLKTINSYAFSGSALENVTIPNAVTYIGEAAFSNVPFTTLNIGNGVVNIDNGAFKGSSKLDTITIPDSTESIGTEILGGRTINVLNIGDGIQSIEAPMFINVTVTTINIGKNSSKSQTIEGFALNSSQLKGVENVNIYGSVKTIGSDAFSEMSVKKVTLAEGITTIEKNVFQGNNIESVILPSTLTTIGERAFAANPNLSVIDDNSGISTCNIVTTNTTINNKKTNTSLTCTTE